MHTFGIHFQMLMCATRTQSDMKRDRRKWKRERERKTEWNAIDRNRIGCAVCTNTVKRCAYKSTHHTYVHETCHLDINPFRSVDDCAKNRYHQLGYTVSHSTNFHWMYIWVDVYISLPFVVEKIQQQQACTYVFVCMNESVELYVIRARIKYERVRSLNFLWNRYNCCVYCGFFWFFIHSARFSKWIIEAQACTNHKIKTQQKKKKNRKH